MQLRGPSTGVSRPFLPVYRIKSRGGDLRPPGDPPPRAEACLRQSIAKGIIQSLHGAALEPPAAADLLGQEPEAEPPEPIRGAAHLPRRVGLIQFALEPSALVGEVLEALAGALVGPVRAIEVAVRVDQAAQFAGRGVEPVGDVVPGKTERAVVGRIRDEFGLKRSGRSGAIRDL